jgi:hypothetical protein
MLKMDILPRQARDKHTENSEKDGSVLSQNHPMFGGGVDVWIYHEVAGLRGPHPTAGTKTHLFCLLRCHFIRNDHVAKTDSGRTQAKLSKRETRFLTGPLLLHFGVESTTMQRIGAASATTKLAGINEVASAWRYDRAVRKENTGLVLSFDT